MSREKEREDYLRSTEQHVLTDMAIQGFIDEEGRVPKLKEMKDLLAGEDIPDELISHCLMMFAMGWQDTRTPDERLNAAKAMHDKSDREAEPLIPIVREMVDELGRMPTVQELEERLTSKGMSSGDALGAWFKVYREQMADDDDDDLAEEGVIAEGGVSAADDEPAEA